MGSGPEKVFLTPAVRRSELSASTTAQPARTKPKGASFAEVLAAQETNLGELKFSAHAAARLRDRQIDLGPAQLQRLEQAVQKAESKGGREALVVMDNVSYVVSVRNRTVITAMENNAQEANVFTAIDSAVVA